MFTIYALTEPKGDETTWRDVRYVGMSVNVHARYGQHIGCSDASHEDKNGWVRGLLERGTTPTLRQIEHVETEEEARVREQYWIRHAMAQGARLFNRAITYVGDERQKAQEARAIRYAKIRKILESGTFIRRTDRWYPSVMYPPVGAGHGHDSKSTELEPMRFYAMIDALFLTHQGEVRSIDKASDEEFDVFIRKYIKVMDFESNKWGWEDRIGAINYARSRGNPPEFYSPPQPPTKSRQEVKSMLRLIRSGDELPSIIA